ncbi:hypothetical protein HZB69_01140 [Candidatus Amesbacteria bacterium]|nr:hypothetical protein [Candidatus Amesbacteria bacterium]
MPRLTKTVSEKNTKQDIFSAYQELLEKAEDQPITQPTLNTVEKYNKTMLTDLLDELRAKFTASENLLISLHKLQEAQKRTLAEEKQEETKAQSRQKEEFSYEFAKAKKRTEEELAELRAKTEADLFQKRQQLKDQEEELIDLRNQAKTFEPRLQKAVNDAVSQNTKELKVTFDHERALLVQEAKMTQSLLEQKIGLFETVVASQKEEIARLAQSATQATAQMTRIAERAVTKVSDQTPVQPKLNQD